jgi:hypothetical protein
MISSVAPACTRMPCSGTTLFHTRIIICQMRVPGYNAIKAAARTCEANKSRTPHESLNCRKPECSPELVLDSSAIAQFNGRPLRRYILIYIQHVFAFRGYLPLHWLALGVPESSRLVLALRRDNVAKNILSAYGRVMSTFGIPVDTGRVVARADGEDEAVLVFEFERVVRG